jgi:hypothetical protein
LIKKKEKKIIYKLFIINHLKTKLFLILK